MGRLLAILIAALAAGCGVRPDATDSCKPRPPIDIEARIVGDPSSPFGIVARASSSTGHEVELEIVLPDGVAHVAGERRARGKHCELRVDACRSVTERREILVRATLRDGDARLTRVVPLGLPGPVPPSKGRLGADSDGRPLLEFRP